MNVIDEIRLLFAELQILAEGMNSRLVKIEPLHVDHQEDIDDMEQRLNRFLSELEWHPIEEGLPDLNGEKYVDLLVTDGEHVDTGLYFGQDRQYPIRPTGGMSAANVTHWMHQPEPPADE